MARLSKEKWQDARLAWESNEDLSLRKMAKILYIHPSAVSKRARAEKWQKGATKVATKVANLDQFRTSKTPNRDSLLNQAEIGEKPKRGRDTLYKNEYDHQTYQLCLIGFRDKDLAEFFGVNVSTINLWKIKQPSFADALKRGKVLADAKVAESLYKLALGCSYEVEKVFFNGKEIIRVKTVKHRPPHLGACIKWLTNRQPDWWRQKI